MLGNPKWFKRRKYFGWGIAAKTWQGTAYMLCIVIGGTVLELTHQWGITGDYQTALRLIFAGLVLLDISHIAYYIDSDEREIMHEALAERNASWLMTLIITMGIIYQVIVSNGQGLLSLNPFLIAALFGGTLAKAITHWYLFDK